MIEPRIHLRAFDSLARSSEINWLLWVEQDGEGDRVDRLWAGRVKLQDDPIATAHSILYDALEKLERALALRNGQGELF